MHLSVHMFVQMSVYMSAQMSACISVHISVHMYRNTCTSCLCTFLHAHVYACVCMRACERACIHVCVQAHVCVHACVCMRAFGLLPWDRTCNRTPLLLPLTPVTVSAEWAKPLGERLFSPRLGKKIWAETEGASGIVLVRRVISRQLNLDDL